MRKWIIVFLTAIFTGTQVVAQIYIEPILGYQVDINNHSRFTQFNTGVQATFNKGKNYELVFRIQKSLGISYRSMDSSFTANPSLPLYSVANKTIIPGVCYFSIDHRFKLNRNKNKNQFSFLLLTGLTAQKITVTYQYDKENYTILNPDLTQKWTNLFVGAGIEYMRLIKENRLFIQLTISSPAAGSKIKYPSSFSFMAPLAFNAGYSILIKKKKHEK